MKLLLGLIITAAVFAQTPAPGSGSISGIVVDVAGKPVAGIDIAYHSATELKATAEGRYNNANPSSGFGQGVARMTPAERQTAIDNSAKINPQMIYVGGTPAGTTDANGAFTIKNLPPDTYVVTAHNNALRQSASRQPIEVKAGEAVRLSTPIQLKRDPGPGT